MTKVHTQSPDRINAPRPAADAAPHVGGAIRPPTILVVDDEPDARELVIHNLDRAGFRVLGAADGVQALALARTELPDLIVLDLMLPEMDGIAVCEMLRGQPATESIPVVMLTAWATDRARQVGLSAGANDYLVKPFSPRELLERINALLPSGTTPHPAPFPAVRRLTIDVPTGRVVAASMEIQLNGRESRLLAHLLEALLSRLPRTPAG